jgi:DNA excision repair protein ERCC-1
LRGNRIDVVYEHAGNVHTTPQTKSHCVTEDGYLRLAMTSSLSDGAIVVNPRQRGNPVVAQIRNVTVVFEDLVPDYVVGASSCALFLSLKFHIGNPKYVFNRMQDVAASKGWTARHLLILVDIDDPAAPLVELQKASVINSWTVLLSWSSAEAARYLETLRVSEKKSADSIKARSDADFPSKVADVLCTVPSVNKRDAASLITAFQSMKNVALASHDQLSLCPGLGEKKVQRIFDTFRMPIAKK